LIRASEKIECTAHVYSSLNVRPTAELFESRKSICLVERKEWERGIHTFDSLVPSFSLNNLDDELVIGFRMYNIYEFLRSEHSIEFELPSKYQREIRRKIKMVVEEDHPYLGREW
jgi:hypothetical protein